MESILLLIAGCAVIALGGVALACSRIASYSRTRAIAAENFGLEIDCTLAQVRLQKLGSAK